MPHLQTMSDPKVEAVFAGLEDDTAFSGGGTIPQGVKTGVIVLIVVIIIIAVIVLLILFIRWLAGDHGFAMRKRKLVRGTGYRVNPLRMKDDKISRPIDLCGCGQCDYCEQTELAHAGRLQIPLDNFREATPTPISNLRSRRGFTNREEAIPVPRPNLDRPITHLSKYSGLGSAENLVGYLYEN